MAREIYITKATYVKDLTLHIVFNDGTAQEIDFRYFLQRHPHPQYNKYENPERFKNFQLAEGNIVWGKNWDLIFPIEQLYQGKIK
ncbi:MAG: DUF2442 domain-containing protein [Prevotellaceae bacterium]|jgi:hypothetical protein|nr:DUF2442 domain-containing protein [Prevotellaceae bacterium]